MDEPGPWLIEGVLVPRALRKWMRRNEFGTPADLVVWVNAPVAARDRGQHVMAVGIETTWKDVRPVLQARGVNILEMSPL